MFLFSLIKREVEFDFKGAKLYEIPIKTIQKIHFKLKSAFVLNHAKKIRSHTHTQALSYPKNA